MGQLQKRKTVYSGAWLDFQWEIIEAVARSEWKKKPQLFLGLWKTLLLCFERRPVAAPDVTSHAKRPCLFFSLLLGWVLLYRSGHSVLVLLLWTYSIQQQHNTCGRRLTCRCRGACSSVAAQGFPSLWLPWLLSRLVSFPLASLPLPAIMRLFAVTPSAFANPSPFGVYAGRIGPRLLIGDTQGGLWSQTLAH